MKMLQTSLPSTSLLGSDPNTPLLPSTPLQGPTKAVCPSWSPLAQAFLSPLSTQGHTLYSPHPTPSLIAKCCLNLSHSAPCSQPPPPCILSPGLWPPSPPTATPACLPTLPRDLHLCTSGLTLPLLQILPDCTSLGESPRPSPRAPTPLVFLHSTDTLGSHLGAGTPALSAQTHCSHLSALEHWLEFNPFTR